MQTWLSRAMWECPQDNDIVSGSALTIETLTLSCISTWCFAA